MCGCCCWVHKQLPLKFRLHIFELLWAKPLATWLPCFISCQDAYTQLSAESRALFFLVHSRQLSGHSVTKHPSTHEPVYLLCMLQKQCFKHMPALFMKDNCTCISKQDDVAAVSGSVDGVYLWCGHMESVMSAGPFSAWMSNGTSVAASCNRMTTSQVL